MAQNSYAQKVRDVIRIDLAGRDNFGYQEIADALDVVSGKAKKPMYRTVADMIRHGELARVGKNSLRRVNKDVQPAPKTTCMWRLIRACRSSAITSADLMANCQVSEKTAREYLQTLVRRGILTRIDRPGNQPSVYRMILSNDPGPAVVRNHEKAGRLRQIRDAKKKAIEQLDAAGKAFIAAAQAIAHARLAVNDISEEVSDGDE
jgi:hypothetical protein